MRQRHPIGLYVLFFTEMWERFGFYCMEAVFVYYMKVSRYEFLRENSSRIYGWYLAGVYFAPFFGGLLAEWRLGYTLSILLGGLSFAVGYGLLAQEPAVCFAVGLGLIIVGNGLFKPNISSLVGKLYPPGDKRIDAAFTIFYMGINVGALMAPLIAAIVGNVMAASHGAGPFTERLGYQIVFMIAAGGILVGEFIYLTFGRLVRPVQVSGASATAGAAEVPADLQARRNLALAIFFGINVLFWMAFKQRANSMALWTRDRMDLSAPAWLADLFAALHVDWLMLKDGQFGKEFFLTLNPFLIIVLSPLLVWFWAALRSVRLEVPTPAKLVLGFLLTAGAFAIMWQCETATPPGERVSSRVLVAFYVALTLGELCLSPMGLSLVSKLAAARTRAVWMGLFFVSTSVGGYLSGEIYQFYKDVPYGDFFLKVCLALLGGTLLMLAAYPVIASALRPAQAQLNE
ncbi:MAG TPA: peptide MFS transporter [Gemmataceae bacterium]|jgi:POT family proton-dependent oligopeptide transporter|nr:peptide MFS transporter [Gemmataceae bacterium]